MAERINPVVKESLYEACERNNQGEGVARMIAAWIEANSTSEVDAADHRYHASVVVNAIEVGEVNGD